MDSRVPALFALSIALLLIANPLYLLPHAGKPVYTHDIEQVPASEVPEEAQILQYENLSPEAKAAIRDARTDDGIVYGQANKPPEFFYSDYAELNQGIYYIQQNGTYYRLTTYAGGGLFPVDLILQWGLIILGLGVGLVGYVSLRDRRRWLPVTFGTFGAVLLIAVAFGAGRESVLGIGNLPLLLLTFGGIIATLVGFGATAGRSLALRTALAFAVPGALWAVLWLLNATPPGGLFGLSPGPMPVVVLALVSLLIAMGYTGQMAYQRTVA